jgi:hypothetical protein
MRLFQQKRLAINCWITGDSQWDVFQVSIDDASPEKLQEAIVAKKVKDPRFTNTDPGSLSLWKVRVSSLSFCILTHSPKVSLSDSEFADLPIDINPSKIPNARKLNLLNVHNNIVERHLHVVIDLPGREFHLRIISPCSHVIASSLAAEFSPPFV